MTIQRMLLRTVGLALIALPMMMPMTAPAQQQQLGTMSGNLQAGTITAIYPDRFLIDGHSFSLTPDVIILDDRGNTLDAGALQVSAEVKYHVKKEQSDKVDRLILTRPR
jgi:hypothetical protein